MIKNFLNPNGYQVPISGSKVTVVLLKGLILPIGELHREGSAPATCVAGPAEQACLYSLQIRHSSVRTHFLAPQGRLV